MNYNDLSRLVDAVVKESHENWKNKTPETVQYKELFEMISLHEEDACIGITLKAAKEKLLSDIKFSCYEKYAERKTLEYYLFKEKIFDDIFVTNVNVKLVLSHFPMDSMHEFDLDVRLYGLLDKESKKGIVDLVSVISRAEKHEINKFGEKSLKLLKDCIIESMGIMFP